MAKLVLVLHSGGLDSTVCLLSAKRAGFRVVSLGIDYGQRLSVELLFAQKQCLSNGVERQVVRVEWRKPQRDLPTGRSVDEIRSGRSPAFLPGRNLLFLSIASAHAAGLGADEVWTGINSIDFSGYPDCTPEFLSAFVRTSAIANPGGPRIEAPLLLDSKPEIARKAKELGLAKGDTWSCYKPVLGSGVVRPCNECDACKLHNYAWGEA